MATVGPPTPFGVAGTSSEAQLSQSQDGFNALLGKVLTPPLGEDSEMLKVDMVTLAAILVLRMGGGQKGVAALEHGDPPPTARQYGAPHAQASN